MKRSKWCKHCDASKQKPACSCIMNYDRCLRKFTGLKDISERTLQAYRDSLAKRIKKLRKDNLDRKYAADKNALIISTGLYYLKECARMLDQEKSALVAARVQEIKEWRRQHV